MADEAVWTVKFKGKKYVLRQSDLTIGNMRQIGAWFGEEYESYNHFLVKLFTENVNALSSALWMMQKRDGENPPEPSHMDFSLADFEKIENEKPSRAKKGNPTPSQTTGSSSQSASSEGDTSST